MLVEKERWIFRRRCLNHEQPHLLYYGRRRCRRCRRGNKVNRKLN